MKKVLISPSRYVQGENELENIGEYAASYGGKTLVIASENCKKRIQERLDRVQAAGSCSFIYGGFNLECTKPEIERLRGVCSKTGCSVVAGIGGGKSIDTAKAVAYYEHLPVIVVPTIASTDAPCSSLAVVYSQGGEFEEYMFFGKNPDLVLVDTAIIAKAPVRFLISGMGDALATYFEAHSCALSGADNIGKGKTTKAALAIAGACLDTLLEDSIKAIAACESGYVTPALENIIEANILLSGIGFESSGLAAAHAIHNGLTAFEETHASFHGEKVAFGVLVHLVLENARMKKIEKIITYCRSVGLPTTLQALGVESIDPKRLRQVGDASTKPDETMKNMPFHVTSDDVVAAIITADKLGRSV